MNLHQEHDSDAAGRSTSRSSCRSIAAAPAQSDALDAHQTMSSQALGSERVRDGLRDILLGPAQLYEALRAVSDQR